MNNSKRTLIIASIILLIPMVVGLVLWNKLPDPMPSHWDFSGNVNDYTSKPLFIFGLPSFELAIIWFSMWITKKDPKNANMKEKRLSFIILLIAFVCVTAHLASLLFAVGYKFDMSNVVMWAVGVMFILLGNMLPKLEQSYTVGIKLPWTLASTENWRLTHRFGGKVFVITGFLIILIAIFSLPPFVFAIVLIAGIIAPIMYSAKIGL